jgi:hypothetical protein
MSELFPLLSFSLSYAEFEECFEGVFECQAGKVTKDERHEMTPEDDSELYDEDTND